MTSTMTNLQRWFDVGALLHWWGAGLFACLPRFIRHLLVPPPTRFILSLQEDGEELILSREGRSGELGRGSLSQAGAFPVMKRRAVVLRLPARRVLSRRVVLPQAAEQNLRQVVGFELDRLTPFTAEKVYYDAHIMDRQTESRRITVQLSAVPRKVLDPLLEALARLQIRPVAVDAVDNPHINLLPQERQPKPRKGPQRLVGMLFFLTVLAVGAAAFLPLWQLRALVIELMPRVDTAQRQAEVVYQLRDQLQASVESSGFLLQKRQQHVSALRVLNELTRIIPDGTWLEQLDMRDGEVQIRGQSREAASLVGIVEASELFENATFRSPVVADQRTGRDRFHLSAQVIDRESP